MTTERRKGPRAAGVTAEVKPVFMLPKHGERAHAALGASNAHRWMACPGSVRLTADIPPTDSEYAREGTGAHELAEACLSRNVDAATFVGSSFGGIEVTDDMAEAVQVYLDAVRSRAVGGTLYIERRIDLHRLNPPGPMFGTADAMTVTGRRLSVVDLKYGRGVPVDVTDNPQLWYYALGCLLTLDGTPVDEVEIVVVQPRALHADGVVRSQVVGVERLLAFASELMERAAATQDVDAPLVVGEHCKFCPAIGRCPAQARHAEEIAQTEFVTLTAASVPDPRLMTPDQLADLLPKLAILEDFSAAVRMAAYEVMAHGGAVRGYKLVQKRAVRKWTDERAVEEYLLEHGVGADEYEDRKLRSPAQIEKLIGRTAMPEHLVSKESSGFVTAPEYDPRPAVALHPGDEFAALGDGHA